jgi:hypothetical protein
MIRALKPMKDVVSALRPGDVRLYLSSRGWVGEPYGKAGKGLLLHHPTIPRVDLLLPLDRELADYGNRMAELVATLATIEERPWDQIIKDLSGPSGDVIRLRVVADDATLGNLPLDEGIGLLRGGRDILVAASCSILRPQPFHPQKLSREVRSFLKSCRLGQTERGSFVATIITPVPPLVQNTMDFVDEQSRLGMEPFSRRVTTRLMTSLGFVSESIAAGTPGQILDGIDRGVSANFCDALQAMRPSGDQSRLDISVTWSATRGPAPKSVPQTVSFPQDSFQYIVEAGRQFRLRAFARAEVYQGLLLATEFVQRPFNPDPVGRIIVASDVAGEAAKIKVDLSPEDFRQACDALPDRKRVSVAGIIRHEVKAREYELFDAHDFRVLEGS